MPAPGPDRSRRVSAALATLAVALGASLLSTSGPARAESPAPAAVAPTAPDSPIAPASPDLPGLPDTAIELAQVPVASPAFDRATAAYRLVDGRHATVQAARNELDQAAATLQGRLGALEATRASAQARIAGLQTRVDVVEAAIGELAVETFVAGDDEERLTKAIVSETPAISEAEQRDVLGGVSMDVLLTERAAYLARIEEALARADQAATDLADAREAIAGLAERRAPAVDAEVEAATAVAEERVAYEEARVLAEVEGVEFPLVALDAYYRAAEQVSETRPGCGLRWWGLAGISRVEGRHGTYGGTTLLANGDTSKRIIGIQLNGTNETAVIGDSDGGVLDGDPQFDRAVGPMQFIPQTWRRYAADGNEDGQASPFNLYDATLAAAGYLCTASGGLEADPGLRAAYLSYNRSLAYVESVLGYARLYERSVEVPAPGS